MPRFKTEADRQTWLAKCAATRAKRKQANGSMIVSNTNGECRKTVKSTGGGIAGALEEIDAKISALQGVRLQLVHAQELVNL